MRPSVGVELHRHSPALPEERREYVVAAPLTSVMLTGWRKRARVSFCRCHARRSASLDCRCVAKETEGRLSAEDSANRPLCAAARNVARRKRPKLPMLWSSAERRRTPEVSGPPRCSAAAYGRGRRKRKGCWPAPSLCFFDRRRGREEAEITPTIYVRLAGEEVWKTFSRCDSPLEENRRTTVAFVARGLVVVFLPPNGERRSANPMPLVCSVV